MNKGLDPLRTQIDRIDLEIVRLLNERAELAVKVGEVKRKSGAECFYSPEREHRILGRLGEISNGPFPESALKAVYREILSGSLSLEKPLRVAFLGPEATFSHEAAVRAFGSSAWFVPVLGIKDVFSAVERGDAEYGVVPVENSSEGVVTYTLDLFINSKLMISRELLLEISQNLLSISGDPGRVKKIYSHPQPTAQCKEWLDRNMGAIPVEAVSSSATAAEMASKDPDSAAIASEAAAKKYGLAFVSRRIQDIRNNVTRFLVISDKTPRRTGQDKTSILLSIKDRVGGLLNILQPFVKHGLNLSRIQSRPSKQRIWEYLFFIELAGHVDDEAVGMALEEVKKECEFLKILGSYPSEDQSKAA